MRGQVGVYIKGDTDRFLRKSSAAGVYLKNIEEREEGVFAECEKKDVWALKGLRRSSGCFLRFENRRGYAFYVKKLFLKRPVLPLFLLLCLFFVWCSGAFVWSVKVDGCVKTSQKELLSALEDTGVKVGAPIKSIRAQRVKNDLISRFSTLSYLTVNVEGTRAHVTVYERRDTPPRARREPCDVISGLTGVVLDVRVKRGESLVKAGQTIEKGDRIASGKIVYKTGEEELLAADAEIDVRTWRKLKGTLLLKCFSFEKTGGSRKNISLIIFGKRIALFPIESPRYKWYYKKEEIFPLAAGKNTDLPVRLSVETFFECERREKRIDAKEAEKILKKRLYERAQSDLADAEVKSTAFYAFKNENACEGVLTVESVETTGIQTEMMTESGTDNQR